MATLPTDTSELFLSRLSETYSCRPGDNVLLECYVRHERVKSVTWYADGEEVEAKGFRMWHRYQPITGLCTFYIRSVLYSDEGMYACQATGLDGNVEMLEIKLRVENYDKAWTRIPVLHMTGCVTTENEDITDKATLTTDNQKAIFDENMFPIHWYELRIDRPLLDPTIALEYNALQLSCRIAGLHVDKFEWYRNGELVASCHQNSPSSLVSTTIDENDRGSFQASYDTLPSHFIALLTVDSSKKERHEGTYECRASNAHYEVSSSCRVIVKEMELEHLSTDPSLSSRLTTEIRKRTDDDFAEQLLPVESKRPRIEHVESDIENQYLQPLTSSPVESRFRIIGDQAVPSVEAKKETKSVKWNEQLETFQKSDLPMKPEMLLPSVPQGVRTSSSDESSSSASAGDLEQVLRSHSLLAMHPGEKQQSDASSSSDTGTDSLGMCPVFFQLLPPQVECEEGERLLLTCQVMAGGDCEIKWSINNMIIPEHLSRTRRHYSPDTGICFIIVEPAIPTDTGLYRLTISNRHGQAQSTCQVQILNRQLPPMPDDDQLTRLYFVKPLPSTPVACHDGDTIHLSCIVHGRRPIHIRWFKDEQLIVIDEQKQHTRQIYFDPSTGRCTLTIHDVYPSDTGVYRCEASNAQGNESTTTTIDVTHYQYEVDSEMSSASFASSPPSDHEDATGSQSFPSANERALYEESRRLVEELDARIAELSSGNSTIVDDVQQQTIQHGKLNFPLRNYHIYVIIVESSTIYAKK